MRIMDNGFLLWREEDIIRDMSVELSWVRHVYFSALKILISWGGEGGGKRRMRGRTDDE